MAALFDADVLVEPLVRRARAGDRIAPVGMEGHRKLTDVMREAGIPTDARKEATIVTDARGEVIWVPGVLRSKEAPVGPLTRSVWAFWIVRGEDAQLQGDATGVTLGSQEDE